MDIRMPEMDGIEATGRITSDPALGHTRVLVLITFEFDECIIGALDAGANGFLLKGGESADVVQATRVVAAGDSLLAPSVTRRPIETYVSQPQTQTDGQAPRPR
jgi:DNA-binding NarL/FixJ family response regulator